MPDFLLTVFTSKNLYSFNAFKPIQKPITTFFFLIYFMPLETHRQSLGIFSGPGNLWKIILCTNPCERHTAQFAEGWSWFLALDDLLALVHTANCMGRKEKNHPCIS